MPPLADNGLHAPLLLPAATVLSAALAALTLPLRHALLIAAGSWALLWVYATLAVGLRAGGANTTRRRFCWAAGTVAALAQLSERAAWDREGMGWAKLLLPTATCLVLESGVCAKVRSSWNSGSNGSLDSSLVPEKPSSRGGHNRGVAIAIALLAVALDAPYMTTPTVALGSGYVLCAALAFVFLESAVLSAQEKEGNGGGFVVSANGSFSRLHMAEPAQRERPLTALRDVAGLSAVLCGVAAYMLETFRGDAITYDRVVRASNEHWRDVQGTWVIARCLWSVGIGALEKLLMFQLVQSQGALRASYFTQISTFFGRAFVSFSLWNVIFDSIAVGSSFLFVYDSSSSNMTGGPKVRLRTRTLLSLFTLLSMAALTLKAFRGATVPSPDSVAPFDFAPPSKEGAPLKLSSTKVHPVESLMDVAEAEFQQLVSRQSKTLNEAVAEYRRRYGIPPPPNFDKWYELAKRKNIQLIDEFDSIHHSFLPFWALKPATIRARVREAIGNEENNLIALMIRDGTATKIERGAEWQQQATLGMIKDFVGWLPDMDVAFNIHDEPRVVVQADKLSSYVETARTKAMPAAFANQSPRNAFSKRPKDMNDGTTIEEVKTTRFNKFAHQATWTHSRASCPIDSPARTYEEVPRDNLTSYALSGLGFVYNATAFSDVCQSPSLSGTFGFFDRPNAYNLVQDLFPIFSQSKISSYQDILYPSPWYWFNKVPYEEEKDREWDNKTEALYWRGSTTGGFSRAGGWRRQHRQRVVQRLNAPDHAKVLTRAADGEDWTETEVPRQDLTDLVDVHFSHVGQCDPEDCDEQKEFFDLAEPADQQDAWRYKHLLDMDGNAFSGRFYAFLQSRSAVYKMAVFREWHQEWVVPWVHFVPLSLRSEETLEVVRYFAREEEGMRRVRGVAEKGREWARKVLRNEDLEVWFARVLLEYGRIIDDDRENIGYPGP